MTDNEIMKALNKIAKYSGFTDDVRNTLELTLDLINRLQAENKRLQTEKDNLIKTFAECQKDVIKEFAERLNDRIVNFPSVYPIESATLDFLNGSSHRQLEILEIIDNLVKEMVGDEDNV